MTEKTIHSADDYVRAQLACYRALGRILALPLDELHQMQERAESVGWAVDPTLWRDRVDQMREDAAVVKALLAAVKATPPAVLRLRDLFIASEKALEQAGLDPAES